jgi:glycosyltransferase involved in cell wall biosynthesis
MRVLMISDVYFPRVNGVSTSIQTFAREFVAAGHDVTLIAPDYGRHDAEPFEVIRIPSRYLPVDPEDRILRVRKLRGHREDLARRGFDLVHIHTPFVAHYSGVALAKRLGLPAVESYHTFFEHYLGHYVPLVPSAWLRALARRLSAAQCNAVDALAVPSQAMLAVLRGYGVRTLAQIIPTGIELTQFSGGRGSRFRVRYGIAPDRPVLVHVSRLAFEKNIDFLLRMLVQVRARLPEVLLVLAGEGPAQGALEAQARDLGLTGNTLFVGYLDRDGDLEDCYSAGDAFVFASRTETQGLVLLEAMALGVPVVSTVAMGTREVLGEGRGSLIAEEDEQAFAEQCVRVLTDTELRQALAREACAHAKSWSAPALAGRMIDFYRNVLESGSAGRAATDPARASSAF